MRPFFKEIRVGRPLLYSVEDCKKVVGILKERYDNDLSGNSSVVLIGHGSSTPANAIYSQIDYMFAANGVPQFHVATVEGYPTFKTTLVGIRQNQECDSRSIYVRCRGSCQERY